MSKTGRPRVNIDKKSFESLCSMQCTEEEIAAFFRCSIDTVNRWCKRTYKQTFADVYNIYINHGKISLRRYQFQHAQKNAGMARWLGEVYLKQRSNQSPGSEDALAKTLDLMREAFTDKDDGDDEE